MSAARLAWLSGGSLVVHCRLEGMDTEVNAVATSVLLVSPRTVRPSSVERDLISTFAGGTDAR